MTLAFHILTALGSLVAAGVLFLSPTVVKLRATYALTAAMLASGTILVVQNTAHLIEACVMGLGLLSVVLYATTSARAKLAHQEEKVQ